LQGHLQWGASISCSLRATAQLAHEFAVGNRDFRDRKEAEDSFIAQAHVALINLTRRSVRIQARPACRQTSASFSLLVLNPSFIIESLRDVFLSHVTGRDSCESFDEQGETCHGATGTCAARDFHHCDFHHLPRDDGFLYLMTTRVVQPPRPTEHNVSVFVNDGT